MCKQDKNRNNPKFVSNLLSGQLWAGGVPALFDLKQTIVHPILASSHDNQERATVPCLSFGA